MVVPRKVGYLAGFRHGGVFVSAGRRILGWTTALEQLGILHTASPPESESSIVTRLEYSCLPFTSNSN